MGIAAALVLLIGGSIAFASQQFGRGSDPSNINVGPPPPPPLTALPPAVALTRSSVVDLVFVAPQNLRTDQHYVMRLFVNGKQVRRLDLPDEQQFTLTDVPLEEGVNSVTASLVGDGGESAQSAAVTLTRDDVAPVIKILEPTASVYTETELLLGKTEGGADIEIADGAGNEVEATIDVDGRFSAPLTLHVGNNVLTLRSTDEAGNKTTTSATIVRSPSAATIELAAAPAQIYVSQLPTTVELTAFVTDDQGQPFNGTVIFGVSPPDRATTTYSVEAANGRARLSDLKIDSADETGAWLVTALATLPSGIELRDDASFSLQSGAPKSPGRH